MKAAMVAGTSPTTRHRWRVLHHDIAGRQHQLRAIVKLYYYVTGEKDPEMYRSAARRQRHRGSDPTCGRLRYTEN